jgi:polyvinyl alcohol dehydrogenase (cytochrome)
VVCGAAAAALRHAPACNAAQSAAITVIPGVIFSGSNDGGIRAFSTKDGAVLWTYDTNRAFDTVNKVRRAAPR